jgi:hypothetical protein
MKIDVDLQGIKFLTPGAIDVLAERRRQRTDPQTGGEGYSDAHDDDHIGGDLAAAAACYAAPKPLLLRTEGLDAVSFADPWPWDDGFDKRPRDRNHKLLSARQMKPALRRDLLVKAAALLIAEIDRLDRAAARGRARG